jgi:hypothetical protein
MKRSAVRCLILAMGIVVFVGSSLAQGPSGVAGHWRGQIEIAEHPLGVTIDLAKNAAGVWIGSITALGTSSVDVPVSDLTVKDATVSFTAALPERASFELSAKGDTMSGTASNEQGSAPLQLAREGEANVKVPAPSSPLAKEFAGDWEGEIQVEGKEARVGLRLSAAADGTATAVLIDRRGKEIPVNTVVIRGKQLQIESRAVSGTYRGTLDEQGEIAGEWSQGGSHHALMFKRAAAKP